MTTQLDAERLEAVGIPVVPITTGRSCHLDAAMVSGGLKLLRQRLNPNQLDLLWVENVGIWFALLNLKWVNITKWRCSASPKGRQAVEVPADVSPG